MDLAAVDLFCGAGGLAEGFRSAGYRVLSGVDSDPDACATFSRNFPLAASICGDLTSPAIRAEVLGFARTADVVIGGPPCQAFSQVRNHDRILEDPRNALYKQFVDIIKESLPLGFLMENVPGMAQMRVQEQVREDLSIDGAYHVLPQLLNACDFGVPQTRERLFFVALHKDLGVLPPEIKGTGASSILSLDRCKEGPIRYRTKTATLWGEQFLSKLQNPDDLTVVSASQAISDLRYLKTGTRLEVLPTTELPRPSSAYQKIMRDTSGEHVYNVSVPRMNKDTAIRLAAIPAGGNYRDLPETLQKRYLSGQKWGPHNGSGKLGRRHYYAYRRLHPDIWAWTLNTKADSVYHWKYERALSVREFARLQTFPDSFEFTTDKQKGPLAGRIEGGPAHSRYRQVGNAVPPVLARVAADALREAILYSRNSNARVSA